MKIAIAPDKFKGSLTSFEVCDAIEKGLLQSSQSFQITKLPMADGGDGLSEIISYYTKAEKQFTEVQDPLGKKINAEWLLSKDGQTAFIEMAKASGLQLLRPVEYDPSLTSTFGTGQVIKEAIKTGVKKIILGIGGSATNDGGIGMAAAVGYHFLDKNKKEILPIGKNLVNITTIDDSNKINLNNVEFQVACDVKNFLLGENGASRIYAPQKGASSQMVEELEKGMINYATVVQKDLKIDITNIEGGGAAGGLGAGCVAFLNAKLVRGIELVIQIANLEAHVKDADLIITGEGKIDQQTLEGKVVSGVALLAKKYSKKVILVCGTLAIEKELLKNLNVTDVFQIINGSVNQDIALKNAQLYLEEIGFDLGSSIKNNTDQK